ncbi:hypothetical protein ABK040_012858 [Willaertia magna]
MNKEKEGKEVKEKSKKKKEKKEKKDTVKTIENYRLGEILGKGGFGTVFKGYNTDTAEFVAVKRITTKKCSKEQIENIHVEITLLKKLNHPRIVRYIDHIQQRSKLYIVIEFVETGSLQDIVQKYGKMKEKIVCMYTAQVLEGLSYLHSEGVIHRDIKGANILTTKEGDIKLADFGVASTLADVDDNPVGTPYWMAPEIIEMNPPTTASDIWSLGATVIELLTGEPPYFGLDPMPALYRIVQDPHPPLPPGISSECEDFLMQCFQKNPQQRKTADQLLHHHWILQGKRKNSNNENLVVDSKEEEKKKNNKLKKFMEEEEDDFDFGDVGSLTLKIGKINSLNEEAEKLKVKKKEKEKKEKEKKDKKKEKKIEKKKVEKDDMDFDIDDNFDFASKLNKFKEDDDDDGFNFSDDENHNPFGGMVNIRPESMDKYRVKKEIKSTFGRENLKKFQDDDDDIISFGDDFDDDSSNKKVDLEAQLKKIQGAFEETIFEFEVEDPLEEAFDTGDNDEDEYAKPEKEFNYLLDRFQQGKMSEEQFISQCNQIVNLLLQYTRLKCIVKLNVSMPFLEVLSMSQQYDSNNAIVAALKLINQFITDDDIAWFQESKRFKETLCLVGFLPVVMQFCKKTYPFAVREQASNFITSMFNTSNLAIRMFIGCQGIKVLVDLLDFDVDQIESSLSLIYEIIDHIDKVINLAEEQTRTPKNDFCRLFSKSGLMTHLSLIFLLLLRKYINAPSDPKSKKYFEKTIGLLVLFSGMDYVVRAHVSQVESLKRILEALTLLKNSDGEQHKFKLLLATAIRNLASHLTVQSFSKAGAIPVLVKLLAERDNELSQQIIPALFHLTKLNRATQIIAVQEGIIPEFQYLFENDFVLKGMIVDIMCEMVRLNPPSVKKELRKTNCVEFYINILGMSAWRLKALESLSKWLNEDKDKIEYALIKNVEHLVEVFSAAPSIFVSSPLLNILTTSTKLSKALSQSTVFITKVIKQALLQQHPDKKVRSDQLRIVHNLYKWCKNPKIMTTELYSAVAHIRDTESSLLIKQTAEDLINAFDLNLKM